MLKCSNSYSDSINLGSVMVGQRRKVDWDTAGHGGARGTPLGLSAELKGDP